MRPADAADRAAAALHNAEQAALADSPKVAGALVEVAAGWRALATDLDAHPMLVTSKQPD